MLPADSLGTRNSGNKEAQKRASFNLRTKDRKFIELRKKAQRGYCQKSLKKLELQQHKYNYIFYNDNNKTFTDDLTIKLSFFNNSTTILIKTYGGSVAVDYWNYYFNKNNFNIKITPTDNNTKLYDNSDIAFNDLISNFRCVNFYNDSIFSQLITHIDYEIGSNNIYIPSVPVMQGYDGYWSLDGITPFDFKNFSISSDVAYYNFIPTYIAKTYTATFYDVDGTTLLGSCKFNAGARLSNLELDFDYSKDDGGLYKWSPLKQDNVSLSSDGQTYILTGDCSFYLFKRGGLY